MTAVSLMASDRQDFGARKPTILQLVPSLEGGGGLEKSALEMLEAISHSGGRALIMGGGGRSGLLARHRGGEHWDAFLGKTFLPWRFFRQIRRVRECIRRENVELVHARSRWPAWVAFWACRAEGIPYLATWHGRHQARRFSPKWFYNRALLKGAKTIAVSEWLGRHLREYYGLPPSRIRVIPRGVDGRAFDPDRVSGLRVQRLIDLWNLPFEGKIILVPARFTAWKGHETVLSALIRLSQIQPSGWTAVLTGVQPSRKYMRKLLALAQEGNILDHVRFMEHCEDMPAAYGIADVVVTPSLTPEPFGRVAVEAQMMARPVVASALGGFAESILDGVTGFLVPPEDPLALALALQALLGAEPDLLRSLGRRTRQRALEYYGETRMKNATLQVYDEILGSALAHRRSQEAC